MSQRITFLGTGTSVGVPMIGCSCSVCTSNNPKNKRLRSSIYLEAGGQSILVDAATDFREQALRYKIPCIDAVLFTHSHADHIFGFDDIRRYNTMQDSLIPAYASPGTLKEIKRVFHYVGTERVPGVFRPLTEFREITGPFSIGMLEITPIPVIHGDGDTLGYRFDSEGKSFGYVPDCLSMPSESIALLKGVDTMILDALRHRPHKTHMTLEESVILAKEIGARQTWFIHMCHDLDHDETERTLPENIRLSYDGLVINV